MSQPKSPLWANALLALVTLGAPTLAAADPAKSEPKAAPDKAPDKTPDKAPDKAQPIKRRVLNRVVAVVEDEAITLAQLEARAKPFLPQLERFKEDERERALVELMRQMLDVVISEKLIALRADELHLKASEEDVDRALSTIAEQSKVTIKDILAEVKKQGFTEAEYREEVRRSVLEFMLLAREVVPKIKREGMEQSELDKKLREGKLQYINELAKRYAVEDRL